MQAASTRRHRPPRRPAAAATTPFSFFPLLPQTTPLSEANIRYHGTAGIIVGADHLLLSSKDGLQARRLVVRFPRVGTR